MGARSARDPRCVSSRRESCRRSSSSRTGGVHRRGRQEGAVGRGTARRARGAAIPDSRKPGEALEALEAMTPEILFGQAYFLRFDPKLWAAQQPYAPLGALYAAACVRERGYGVALFDGILSHSA